jgi:very-short-patch-repair endonuclease
MEPLAPRTARLSECIRVARRQYGAISRQQAHAAGLSSSAITRLAASGLWKRVQPGVFALWEPCTHDERWRQGLASAALWLGPGSAVSYRAAALLWELDGFESALLDMSTTHYGRRSVNGVAVHRVGTLGAGDITRRAGLPVTTIARTILDLAGLVPTTRLEVAVESAVRRRLTTYAQLEKRLDTSPPTTSGRGVLRQIVSQAPKIATESAFEARVWQLLLTSGLPRPRRQHEIRDEEGRLVARVDFAYPEALLAIEAEGYRFHSSRKDWTRDIARHNALTRLGWTIARVTWEDLKQPNALDALVRALLARHPKR